MVFGSLAPPASPPSVTGLPPDDGGHTVQYHLRGIPTRSVRLSPSRAYVVRDIDDISLQPGTNHVTIVGLSPTVDEHSIKLEVSGPVSITDFSVHLLPNREIFEDVYPASDDDGGDDDNDDSDSESASSKVTNPEESESILALRKQISSLHDDKERAAELVASAEARLKILDAYGRRIVAPEPPLDITAGLDTYRSEREKAFRDSMDGKIKSRNLSQQILKLTSQIDCDVQAAAKAHARLSKAQLKVVAAKQKERQSRQRKAAESYKEKQRIRKEREACWPRHVHVVTVTLEMPVMTPGSTRRNSISSDLAHSSSADDADGHHLGTKGPCGLTLSYMTTSAYWTPTYDLALSTVSSSAVLCFDALLTNYTSETWSGCKISLTTSQAESTDLADKLPNLHTWQVKLADKDSTTLTERVSDNILYSQDELKHKSNMFLQSHSRTIIQSRSSMFGYGSEQGSGTLGTSKHAWLSASAQTDGSAQSTQAARPGGLFGSSATTTTGFGGGGTSATSLFGQKPNAFGAASQLGTRDAPAEALPTAGSSVPSWPSGEEDLSFIQMGLTSNYELPGMKTLKPRAPTANGVGGSSRHRVTRITNFTEVTFSRTVVAKLKAAAYLRVKLRNSSQIPILSGLASLTLDGSFLGRMQLPPPSGKRLFGAPQDCVKPGEYIHLDLGKDPSVEVSYQGPLVKTNSGSLSAAGTMIKERASEKGPNMAASAKPVALKVVDQIPTTEDERVRIEILRPRGLVVDGGQKHSSGENDGDAENDGETAWGTALASLLHDGKVEWDVTLNPSKTVKLTLEYQCSYPKGESVVNIS
ncbi:uncharacterized protein B0I36DRAFT_286259 [Microdochium trichocladiopsis]|uniref:DUF4139 domain-containing protein n=1 Tax=Microdochium trichocladiopsis TaxID=1682393 RepID=A0A9P8YD74_9PEZI|nr:uncharacterized protein B0I36DRAFT_286259 [Microdochium trichocladiopsis]KAH7035785.1 hypothetical protein B0I36DRAFT_286259 [Microdochium trichocladiopsis]